MSSSTFREERSSWVGSREEGWELFSLGRAQSSLALWGCQVQPDSGSEQLQHLPHPSHADGDVLCLPGSLVSAPGPVLVPTRLQTELVLRCHEETDCDLCVRVAVHLAVQGEPIIL